MSRPTSPGAAREGAVVATTLAVFTWLHNLLGKDEQSATEHAHGIQALEAALHLDIETAANAFLVGHPWLIGPAVAVYRLYYLVPVAALVWLYLRHRADYVVARRTLVVLAALALLGYAVFPLAPPRLALPGVVDVIREHDLFGRGVNSGGGGNHNSAMPSMHVGWSAWAAYAVWLTRRATGASWWPWAMPLVMTAVVLGTGNHYVLDVVGSAVVVTAAALIARALPRRPTGR